MKIVSDSQQGIEFCFFQIKSIDMRPQLKSHETTYAFVFDNV